MSLIDETHDPSLRSWVPGAREGDDLAACDFPIQNLPYGRARRRTSGDGFGLVVAIGDHALDLRKAAEGDRIPGISPEARCALSASTLNDLMGLGRSAWRDVRRALSALLRADAAPCEDLLIPLDELDFAVPAEIRDYTDFYCSIQHATNVGSMFRPDNPLLPNYRHLPIGYHGRASSIVISGTPVRRPRGQVMPAGADAPEDAPIRLFDYEMEMGFYVGRGNDLGTRIEAKDAGEHVFGLSIVNDWSARDVQKWEYQPLGPFNAKNFCTTVSPWVVTTEALAPVRKDGPPRGAGDPPLLDYLKPADPWSLDVEVEVHLSSKQMRDAGTTPFHVSTGNLADLYWTVAQMLVHHSSTGCNLQSGDLIATGTISGEREEARGCLLERTWRGEQPLALPDGTERKFLQDGDEVVMTAAAKTSDGVRIGFGNCRGVVQPVD